LVEAAQDVAGFEWRPDLGGEDQVVSSGEEAAGRAAAGATTVTVAVDATSLRRAVTHHLTPPAAVRIRIDSDRGRRRAVR
jgi:hypothetical protein